MQGVLTRIPRALGILALLLFAASALALPTSKIPDAMRAALVRGEPQEVLVLFDDQAIQAQAATLRKQFKVKTDTGKIQQQKSAAYFALKQRVLAAFPAEGYEMMRNYSHLPLALLRIKSLAALEQIAAHPEVIALYVNQRRYPVLAQSLPLIGQPAAAAAGDDGAGATVLVIDSGVDYTRAEFGSCTAPGTPASCKVVYYANNADTSTALDTLGHGTLVSGVTVGVAPGAKLAVFNVFGASSSATDADINEAINWGIANQALYNIVAMNLSLGGGPKQTSPCGNKGTNPYVTTFGAAKSAGIMPVAASGNDGYIDGMLEPGCTPSAVSVGAVYDANVGQVSYGACTDTTSVANKVACFSNSAYFLTLLAPGSLITVTGTTSAGTSFATPHVAGVAAVLRAAYFTETVDETVARMTTTGLAVTDSRNAIVTPRIDLTAAARPANDAFAKRILLSGASGTVIGYNVLATKEAGEPNHASNSGGASVWWKWTAPSAGQASFDTHGSVADTLLAVYTGGAVSALTLIAGNDNDGTANGASGVLFQAQAGVEYQIAVDGANGVANDLALNWSLTAAQADIFVVSNAAPEPVTIDTDLTYTLTINNNGPQTATNVVLSDTLPPGALFISATTGCTHSAGIVTCVLGTLANGASSLVNIVIRLSNAGTAINNASVTSDVPDPNSANNTDSDTTPVAAAVVAADDGDIPTLPEWGAILMAGLLLGAAYWRQG
ncbi:MAG: IPTL-CTERM sorting domain-containing protein [Hydrogenophilales bacterium]|nr:IPTL-CTERM sorting domain-containing protein [Hydrogenophilales bacterium]